MKIKKTSLQLYYHLQIYIFNCWFLIIVQKYKEADAKRRMLARRASEEFQRLAMLATRPKLLQAVQKAQLQSRKKPTTPVNPSKDG